MFTVACLRVGTTVVDFRGAGTSQATKNMFTSAVKTSTRETSSQFEKKLKTAVWINRRYGVEKSKKPENFS